MPNHEPKSDGRVFDKTTVTLLVAGLAAIGLTGLIVSLTPRQVPEALSSNSSGSAAVSAAPAKAAKPMTNVVWATSAPGRVEPKGGEVRVQPEAQGRITDVFAAAGDVVREGDMIARLRDDDAFARLTQARAEVAVRIGERDEEKEKIQLVVDRRKAADELGNAERAVHKARMNYDSAFLDRRAGRASDADVDAARKAIKAAEDEVIAKAGAYELIAAKADMPLPTRLDSGLTLARADLRLAEIAYENRRVRAPVSGTLLRFDAKVGEFAAPNQRAPIAVIGDMSAVQITAEVPERDVSKVRVGQSVIVRSNAFVDTEFTGKVVEVAPSVGSPGLRAQGPRQQLDAEVLEVTIELEGKPSVMPGMRVDVFFKSEQRVSAVITHRK
jgi:HlyD family secretion protein